MTSTKSIIDHALAQAATIMLSTTDADIGIVPARSAAAEAAKEARRMGEAVTLRDTTTDELIATCAPSGDISPAAPAMPRKRLAYKRTFTKSFVSKLKAKATAYMVWDLKARGLTIRMQPSGRCSWYAVYNRANRTRWLYLGDASTIDLATARQMAAECMLAVAKGGDPASEKRAQRASGSFSDLADRYVEQHAKKHNKSWRQAAALINRFALPRWGKLAAVSINRSDVRALLASIEAPVVANQTLAAISAIFSFATNNDLVAANPCRGIERNPTKDRERVLSESEIPKFWSGFGEANPVIGAALKVILLTGQRPGEVSNMRREHIVDGWWEMPGEPVPPLGWPGTKNGASHRVWLPAQVRQLIGEGTTGFVFGTRGRAVRGLDMAMRAICARLGAERATPHDLRRTFSTTVTSLGFGRDALNRVTNHKEGGIASVYDRHGYADENKRVMESVAAKIMSLAEGKGKSGNVELEGKNGETRYHIKKK